MSGTTGGRRAGPGRLVLGAILVLVGGHYVLRNTLGFHLPELDGDRLVPLVAVVFGLLLVFRSWQDRAPRAS